MIKTQLLHNTPHAMRNMQRQRGTHSALCLLTINAHLLGNLLQGRTLDLLKKGIGKAHGRFLAGEEIDDQL